jgi:DNA helicase HerA-like ATPase
MMSISIAETVASRAGARTTLAAKINDDSSHIGGVYRLDYHSALVLTDDFRKSQAGGVPQGGFLLAAAGAVTRDGFVLDDQEIILLRVKETAPLPNEGELVQTRLAVVRDASTTGRGFDEVADVLTRGELQQSAFDCEVLGTFYESNTEPGKIEYGADIDNVVSSARYQVFLPSSAVLSWLASFADSEAGDADLLRLGVVRFASTLRRAREARADQAPVFVHVSDFVTRKTAVFGMTRTGKSNTIKTLVTAVFRYGKERGQAIGQLIFDPQGEYANVNPQDDTGLRLLGDTADDVRVYKVAPSPSDGREQPLRLNFLDPSALATVWEMVQTEVSNNASGGAQYMAGFRAVSMVTPSADDHRAMNHFERNRLAVFALIHRAGIGGNLEGGISLTLSKELVDELTSPNSPLASRLVARGKSVSIRSTDTASELFRWIQRRHSDQGGQDFNGPRLSQSWVDDLDSGELADIVRAMTGRAADAAIKRLKPFHDARSRGDIGEKVWDDMRAGRLVVIDLSQGNDVVVKALSERIVTVLLDHARDNFANNVDAIPFQIVVEEAHNLFERNSRANSLMSPWVRLSKEAAKYKIGMIYATQEVSSVDQRILSNTSNWLVAHLNSDNETRELSHYYDFKVWADSLRKCEDIGFVRMKTYSGKYIVPVQVARFDHAMINEARKAAGLNPVSKAS